MCFLVFHLQNNTELQHCCYTHKLLSESVWNDCQVELPRCRTQALAWTEARSAEKTCAERPRV